MFTCKLWASVCHVYQTATWGEREERADTLTHTQVQTSPASLVSVADALMGVGGGGWHWAEGGQVQTWTSKKACWTLINKLALIRHKRMEQMKGVLMHLHLRSRMYSALSAADLSSQATLRKCTVSRNSGGRRVLKSQEACSSVNSKSFTGEC